MNTSMLLDKIESSGISKKRNCRNVGNNSSRVVQQALR